MSQTIFVTNYNGQYGNKYELKAEGWEKDKNDDANTSTVVVDLYMRRTDVSSNGAYNNYGTPWSINIGDSYTEGNSKWSTKNTNAWQYLGSYSKVVTHNPDGTGSVWVQGWHQSNVMGNAQKDGWYQLDTLNRYAEYTECKISGRTSTSLTVTWDSKHNCDAVMYRINDGEWVGASGKTFTISNLNPNTTYKVQVSIRRADSGLWSMSGEHYGTTYQTTTASIWLNSKTSSSLTVGSNSNVTTKATQYRIKKSSDSSYGSWQNSATFTGLNANTTYNIQVGVQGTDSGEWGYATGTYTTHYQTIASIGPSSKTSSSITVWTSCNVAASVDNCRIKPTSSSSWGAWTAGKTFTGLSANTSYDIQVGIKATASGEWGYATVTVVTYNKTIPTISLKAATINTIEVTSGCNVDSTNTKYQIAKSIDSWNNQWQTSGLFKGLKYNTEYDIQVSKQGTASGETGLATIYKVKTLDIARIINYNTDWNVEDTLTFNITNPGNCVMRLYLLYNGVEILYRNNITITNGTYIFALTNAERNQLYSLAASQKNPDFKFVLKSYYDSVLVDSDTAKVINISFPTKAWIKIGNNWKRALVWLKTPTGVWKQSNPWIDVSETKDWKRV